MEEIVNFKNVIEKLEYIGENINSFRCEKYKDIILINFLQELIKCDDISIKKSLDHIILQKCKYDYYEEYRRYKHYPNEFELRNNMKSIEKRFIEFIDFIKSWSL